MGTELDLMGDVRHTAVRSPWQDGHVENFFGILHRRLEGQLAGYCGNSPENRPEAFPDLARGPNVWKGLLTLEQLNETLQIWIVADYHTMRHRRLKMSRVEYWKLHAGGHVHVPDESWLRQTLMRRDQRKISRGKVNLNTFAYWHERLMGYEGVPLGVRWDPADLSRVLVLDLHGQQLCWAERERPGRVDSPADLAALKERRGRVKAERQMLQMTAEVLAGGQGADREAFERALREARQREPIHFTRRLDRPEPKPLELLTGDEILEQVRAEAPAETAAPREEASEPLMIHGMEV
jgi:hypothetical protein